MKKVVLLLVFTLHTGLLFAQDYREPRIFVPPVTGYAGEGDNAYFYMRLTYEVVLQYHSIVRSQRASDYILKGAVKPYTGMPIFDDSLQEVTVEAPPSKPPPQPFPRVRNTFGRREFFSQEFDEDMFFYDTTGEGNIDSEADSSELSKEEIVLEAESGEFVFTLELVSSSTNTVIARQYIIYAGIDSSVGGLLSIIVYNMLTMIPDINEDHDWREKWLYLRASFDYPFVFYTLQSKGLFNDLAVYKGDINKPDYFSTLDHKFTALPGMTIGAEFQYLYFMSFGFNCQIFLGDTKDNSFINAAAGAELKFPLKFLPGFLIEPYLGLSFPLNVSPVFAEFPSIAGGGGVLFAVKGGKNGAIFIDVKYLASFNDAVMHNQHGALAPNPSKIHYQRSVLGLGVGYKYGFFNRAE
jgi:hypothetical protein